VVWVGVDPEGSLDRLAGWVEDRVVESGLPAERRPFRVHLTLGRVRSERGHVPREALAARSEQVYGAVPVERIVVFESRLTPTGARYTPLDTVPLRPGEGPG
jgi:2'-5' RNA ligase